MAMAEGVPVPNHKITMGSKAMGAIGLNDSTIGSKLSRRVRFTPMAMPKIKAARQAST